MNSPTRHNAEVIEEPMSDDSIAYNVAYRDPETDVKVTFGCEDLAKAATLAAAINEAAWITID